MRGGAPKWWEEGRRRRWVKRVAGDYATEAWAGATAAKRPAEERLHYSEEAEVFAKAYAEKLAADNSHEEAVEAGAEAVDEFVTDAERSAVGKWRGYEAEAAAGAINERIQVRATDASAVKRATVALAALQKRAREHDALMAKFVVAVREAPGEGEGKVAAAYAALGMSPGEGSLTEVDLQHLRLVAADYSPAEIHNLAAEGKFWSELEEEEDAEEAEEEKEEEE